MVRYRRNRVKGGTYFFTVALKDRKLDLLVRHIKLLMHVMSYVKKQQPYKEHAVVILPDHLHTVWELPHWDTDYSIRWRSIKSLFTRYLRKQGAIVNKNGNAECDIWQRRFWEHTIRDTRDYCAHIDYIHYNPVKHKLVRRVADWPYSSFHRYVREGILSENWSSWTEPNVQE